MKGPTGSKQLEMESQGCIRFTCSVINLSLFGNLIWDCPALHMFVARAKRAAGQRLVNSRMDPTDPFNKIQAKQTKSEAICVGLQRQSINLPIMKNKYSPCHW
jgi:hypothetical protein